MPIVQHFAALDWILLAGKICIVHTFENCDKTCSIQYMCAQHVDSFLFSIQLSLSGTDYCFRLVEQVTEC